MSPPRHALALVVVAVERDFAVLDALGRRLGDVVQQRRPAQREARRRAIEHLQRVAEDVLVTPRSRCSCCMPRSLGTSGRLKSARSQVAQQADPARRSRSEQQLFELVAHPFAADRRQRGRGCADGRGGFGLDLEAEPARKADRAQQPQRVLAEALGRRRRRRG